MKRIYNYVSKDIMTNPANTGKRYPVCSNGIWSVYVEVIDPVQEVYKYWTVRNQCALFGNFKRLADAVRSMNTWVSIENHHTMQGEQEKYESVI